MGRRDVEDGDAGVAIGLTSAPYWNDLGTTVRGIGDVNNDGLDDIGIGESSGFALSDPDGAWGGSVHVVYGRASTEDVSVADADSVVRFDQIR